MVTQGKEQNRINFTSATCHLAPDLLDAIQDGQA